jgi:hypothetical protein
MPMAPRPGAEEQKAIDQAWDNALRPVDRYGHQALLDILLGSRGFEAGVDKLTFRSEKRVAAGTVVMEVHYDRLDPEGDRFEVKVVDRAGKVLRKERYDRKEVEQAYKTLFTDYQRLRWQKGQGNLSPEDARRLAEVEARRKVMEEAFPKFEDKKDKKE